MSIALEENDVYLVDYVFHDFSGSEKRPMVLTHVRIVNNLIVAYAVYSFRSHWRKYPETKSMLCKIEDTKSAGLKKISYIDVTEQTILQEHDFINAVRIGKLAPKDILGFDVCLRDFNQLRIAARQEGRRIMNFADLRDLMDKEFKQRQAKKNGF